MGLAPSEWHKLMFREIWAILAGYNKKQQDSYRNTWEQVRWLAYQGARPHARYPDFFKPTDLILFTWDKPPESTPSTKERYKGWKTKYGLN